MSCISPICAFVRRAEELTLFGNNTSSLSNGGGSKRGIGYNDARLTTKLNIRWAYNWGRQPDGALNSGVEYVAMLYVLITPPEWTAVDTELTRVSPTWSGLCVRLSWDASNTADWADKANAALASGSTHLLAFNEPDLDTQANMPVSESVRAWKEHISPFAGRARIGSMAVTNGQGPMANGQDPMGPLYIKRFFEACPQCEQECSFVALHWYDQANNVAYFKVRERTKRIPSRRLSSPFLSLPLPQKHLQDAYALLKKPIWLTEFQGYGTVAEQQALLREVIPWMEEQAFIERYAGFGDFIGNYVADQEGNLTPLGETYSNA